MTNAARAERNEEEERYHELLANCAREPIHRPGRVQAHGALLILEKAGQRIRCISDNLAGILGMDVAHLLDAELSTLPIAGTLSSLVQQASSGEANVPLSLTAPDGQLYDVSLMRSEDGHLIIELENASTTGTHVQLPVFSAYTRMRTGQPDLSRALEIAAQEVKAVSGFDRVMVYRFHEDWHGEVVAEAIAEGMGSFMGLHFPASDIPPQARELYRRYPVRQIPDVVSATHGLVVSPGHEHLLEMDMSAVGCRAVSPVHIAYLKNMGVGASFSISIIAQDRLWGLIACHHPEKKIVPPQARISCQLITQFLSVLIDAEVERTLNQAREHADRSLQRIADDLRSNMRIQDVLHGNADRLMQLFKADGFWSNVGGEVIQKGLDPGKTAIAALMDAMMRSTNEAIFTTERIDRLPVELPGVAFAGFLGIRIQPEAQGHIFFLREEKRQQIAWAGLPQKSDIPFKQGGLETLGPRKSFKKWEAEVRGTSEKWTYAETAMAGKLHEAILNGYYKRSVEVQELNRKLRDSYDELESFSYTISHDLRTPLGTITNFAEIILKDPAYSEADDLRLMAEKIARNSRKMGVMMDHVLDHSKMGKVAIKKVRVPVMDILASVHDDQLSIYRNKPEQHRFVVEAAPDIFGDPVMVAQVFSNLISNAFKYSQYADDPQVRVSGRESATDTIYTISDNGIGLDMKDSGQIFELFQRSTNVDEYEGSGVGLAIVKRIMERHGGWIDVSSELGKGSRFTISFPKK